MDKPSTSSIGDVNLLVVRKAAKFAVYDVIIINAKNHHIPTTSRALTDLGLKSIPCKKSKITKKTKKCQTQAKSWKIGVHR